MGKFSHTCLKWLAAFGVEPIKTVSAVRNLPATIREYRVIKKQNASISIEEQWKINLSSPSLHDRFDAAGIASGHYFHQDLLVARRIHSRNPSKHVDVGSRVDGFVAHVSIFREIEVLDIRPINTAVPNIRFLQRDLMNPSEDLSNYCDSLSCLHALEHFGLGRYGDAIDVTGYLKGFEILGDMLKPEGMLYLSVPIGKERVEFNGQRVFSIRRLMNLFKDKFELVALSYVDDAGDLQENVSDPTKGLIDNFGLSYGCGIFELKKI